MSRFLHCLAAALSLLTLVGAADLSGILKLLPEGWAALAATLPPLALALGHCALALGDQLDDGVRNHSFPPKGGREGEKR